MCDIKDWRLLSDHFSLRDGSVPMSAFQQMHQIEADSCEEGNGDFGDMWTSLYLIGYDDFLQLKKACPYKLYVDSEKKIELNEDFRTCSKEERAVLTAFFYEKGTTIPGPLELKLFKTEYFGVLIADVKDSKVEEQFQIKIEAPAGVQLRSVVDLNDFKPATYGSHVSLAFFTSTDPDWDLVVTINKIVH